MQVCKQPSRMASWHFYAAHKGIHQSWTDHQRCCTTQTWAPEEVDDDDFLVVPMESTSEYENEIVNMHEQNIHKPQTLLIMILMLYIYISLFMHILHPGQLTELILWPKFGALQRNYTFASLYIIIQYK